MLTIFLKRIPAGVIIMFASYAAMNTCYKLWSYQFSDETSKVCVKEYKDKQKSEESISTFFDICENEEEYNGAILFAVVRGKYSEGYNFKDELCRGLFLVGVPNLPLCSPESVLKVRF